MVDLIDLARPPLKLVPLENLLPAAPAPGLDAEVADGPPRRSSPPGAD